MKGLIFLLKTLKIALRAIGRTLFLVGFPRAGERILNCMTVLISVPHLCGVTAPFSLLFSQGKWS